MTKVYVKNNDGKMKLVTLKNMGLNYKTRNSLVSKIVTLKAGIKADSAEKAINTYIRTIRTMQMHGYILTPCMEDHMKSIAKSLTGLEMVDIDRICSMSKSYPKGYTTDPTSPVPFTKVVPVEVPALIAE